MRSIARRLAATAVASLLTLLTSLAPASAQTAWDRLEVCTPVDVIHLPIALPTATVGVRFGSPEHGQVLFSPGTSPTGEFAVEYSFVTPCEGTYRLELKLAAAESRPLEAALVFDGNRMPLGTVAAGATGGWNEESQVWRVEGPLARLRKGQNTLRLSTTGFFPHVSERPGQESPWLTFERVL